MALLMSCWFIIESVVIPGGFLKWFYLSFYIHPIFLFVCQIFLCLVFLKRLILAILCYVLRVVYFLALCVFRFFKSCVIYLFKLTRLTSNIEVVEDVQNLGIVQNCRNQIVDSSCVSLSNGSILFEVKVLKLQLGRCEEDNDYGEDDDYAVLQGNNTRKGLNLEIDNDTSKNECFSSVFVSYSPTQNADIINQKDPSSFSSSSSVVNNLETDEYLQSNSLAVEEVTDNDHDQDGEESDPFYEIYQDRMKWFDLLSYERRCGISAILSNQPGTPNSLESTNDPMDFSVLYFTWGRMARNMLLRSLESDFELVYVAQSCLSWEALHHQYKKVEALASQDGIFYSSVAGEFQNFQILLERFLEDERCQGQRVWNYVQGRSSQKSFLQVPEVSGFSETKNGVMRGEAISVKEVLKVIELCIKAYWEFIKAEDKKSWWKLKSSWTNHPSVENPRDLELLADLTKRLQKKEQEMKDLQGKRRHWFKRSVNPLEESQRKEILLAMIDMKLVWRVLQMSMVSSSYLKWCQEKLQQIQVKEGKVLRAWPGPLFPPS